MENNRNVVEVVVQENNRNVHVVNVADKKHRNALEVVDEKQ